MTKLITKEYQGTPFVFREDGYFNMTKAAEKFGKRLDHFMASPDTIAYIAAIKEVYSPESGDLIQTRRGNGGGTWAHPKLAIRFAQWLDVRFAVWCDAIIEDILTKKADLIITQPATSATVKVTQDMPDFMVSIQQMAMGIMHTHQRVGEVEQRLEVVEKNVEFSAELVTLTDFFKTYGICVRSLNRMV